MSAPFAGRVKLPGLIGATAPSIDAEEMIMAMTEAGIDKMVMVHSSTTCGFNCDYVADAVARYPKKFTGVFRLM